MHETNPSPCQLGTIFFELEAFEDCCYFQYPFAYDFSVTALIPSKCTKEKPSPFRKISLKLAALRCLGAKDRGWRGMCLKKRYVPGYEVGYVHGLGFTMQIEMQICSKSEWGSTSTVLMFMLYWREQMIGNCTYLLRKTRPTHTVNI